MSPTDDPILIALWSVPRARSTAFLRMMTERGDVAVVHEPFSRVTDFGEVTIGATPCHDPQEVKAALVALSHDQPVFFKDTMDFRYPSVLEDVDFLRAATHTLMIRRPEDVVASHLRVDPQARMEAMGFELLLELAERVGVVTGREPWVLDGDDLMVDPGRVVEGYCDHVGIPFDASALEWSAGHLDDWRQASAGWHDDVAASTGFVARPPRPLSPAVQPLADAFVGYHRPYYEKLRERVTIPVRTDEQG